MNYDQCDKQKGSQSQNENIQSFSLSLSDTNKYSVYFIKFPLSSKFKDITLDIVCHYP